MESVEEGERIGKHRKANIRKLSSSANFELRARAAALDAQIRTLNDRQFAVRAVEALHGCSLLAGDFHPSALVCNAGKRLLSQAVKAENAVTVHRYLAAGLPRALHHLNDQLLDFGHPKCPPAHYA